MFRGKGESERIEDLEKAYDRVDRKGVVPYFRTTDDALRLGVFEALGMVSEKAYDRGDRTFENINTVKIDTWTDDKKI